jgi:putative endonuclease
MPDKPATWYVYLLECRGGAIYTGIAIDVDARFRAHVSGRGARYTRAHPPVRVIARFPHPDRAAASRAEAAIKRLSAHGKRELARATGAMSFAAAEG